MALVGIGLAFWLFSGERKLVSSLASSRVGRLLSQLWLHAWGFDWLYDRLFVRPYLWLTRILAADPCDRLMELPAWFASLGNQLLGKTVSGKLRWYAASMGLGTLMVLALLLLV